MAYHDVVVAHVEPALTLKSGIKKTFNLDKKHLKGLLLSGSTTKPISNFLDLLPQNLDALLRSDNFNNVVKILNLFIKELKYSLEDFFINRNYAKFDPHVWDTACHVRAFHLLALAQFNSHKLILNGVSVEERLNEIQQLEIQFNKWVENLKPKEFKHKKIKLFFGIWQNKFECSQVEIFLLQTHFLSKAVKFAKDLSYTYIDHNCLNNEIKLSRNNTEDVILKFQRFVAQYSIDYFLQLLNKTKQLKLKFSPEDVGELINFDEYNRKLIPAFLATEIILENLLKNSLGLIFVIQRKVNSNNLDRLYFAWRPNKDKSGFILQKLEELNSPEPYYIVYGYMNYDSYELIMPEDVYMEQLKNFGLENIFLANLAAHPQFSGTRLLAHRENCFISNNPSERLLNLQQRKDFFSNMAVEKGFCSSNLQFMYIQHAYIDAIDHIMSNNGKLIDAF